MPRSSGSRCSSRWPGRLKTLHRCDGRLGTLPGLLVSLCPAGVSNLWYSDGTCAHVMQMQPQTAMPSHRLDLHGMSVPTARVAILQVRLSASCMAV